MPKIFRVFGCFVLLNYLCEPYLWYLNQVVGGTVWLVRYPDFWIMFKRRT